MIKLGNSIIQKSLRVNKNVFEFLKKPSLGMIVSERFFRPGILHPHGYSFDWAWKAAIPNIDTYTHLPLPTVRTGGRGPNGRIELKHISGGLKKPTFLVSKYRGGLSNGSEHVISEKIIYIHKNWWRPENIALVARGLTKRWIYATTSMKVGDIVNSYGIMKQLKGQPKHGDAYNIGCLSVGMSVCQVERYPGQGAHYAINAGTQAVISQMLPDDSVVIKIGKRLIKLSSGCTAVFGQMSNPDHHKIRFRKFGELRWLGYKQRSGLKQKKTGRFGRKIYGVKPPLDYTLKEKEQKTGLIHYSKPNTPAAMKREYSFKNPVNLKPIPVEENETHPRFKWFTWPVR